MSASDWSYDSLYKKARIYIERALMADRNSSLFPLWSSLSLELLGRATLAKIHPVLIADPQSGSFILHAFGFSKSKEIPKTIGAKTVFLRLQIICPDFTEENEQFCQAFINMRNEELHTGTPVFEGYSTNAWLTSYYASIKSLLNHQGKSLSEFLGSVEATIAEQMIAERKEELVGKVNQLIKKHRDEFDALNTETKGKRKEANELLLRNFITKEKLYERHKIINCPSCTSTSLIIGTFISKSEPKVHEDLVIVRNNILPVELKCFCCHLNLIGNGELSVVDLGGQFALEEMFDPVQYYGIETDPIELLKSQGYSMEDVETALGYGDYGND
ncbi:MAG TPA: hypothetical protein VK772_15160 [Puia sp.]|jgi:hypothetical protein|nr:hypothetical protein [Puia sp.]